MTREQTESDRPRLSKKYMGDLREAVEKQAHLPFLRFAKALALLGRHDLVDKGKLAEFYCANLFGLVRQSHGADFRAPNGRLYEVKHRKIAEGRTPGGMKIHHLASLDSVLYVKLDTDLLPKEIFQIRSEDVQHTSRDRVSFAQAFAGGKAERIFERVDEQ